MNQYNKSMMISRHFYTESFFVLSGDNALERLKHT